MFRTMLVTIHDIEPQRWDQFREILDYCNERNIKTVMAVIPCRSWTDKQFDYLRLATVEGHILAQHGFSHTTTGLRQTIFSRLHSRLFSRTVAEHLSYPPHIQIERIFAGRNILRTIDLASIYIPPAWSLGRTSASMIHDIGFDVVETLFGYRFRFSSERLPLCGYEGVSAMRCRFLRLWNSVNEHLPSNLIRIAIHTNDFNLPLKGDLLNILERHDSISPQSLFGNTDG